MKILEMNAWMPRDILILFRAERAQREALREAESNLNFFFAKRGQNWSILL